MIRKSFLVDASCDMRSSYKTVRDYVVWAKKVCELSFGKILQNAREHIPACVGVNQIPLASSIVMIFYEENQILSKTTKGRSRTQRKISKIKFL